MRRSLSVSSDAVFTRLSDDSATILNLTTKRYYSLNSTGIRIWELVEAGKPGGEIKEILVAEYDVDVERARQRVDVFFEELLAEGLLLHSPA